MVIKRKPLSEETKLKISLANKGKKLSEAHKAALRKGHKKMSADSRARMSRGKGSANHHWSGGNWRFWKTQALIRDNWICQQCDYSETEIMEVDHIIPKSERPDLALEINNLVTLCPNCHRRKTIKEHKAREPWNKGLALQNKLAKRRGQPAPYTPSAKSAGNIKAKMAARNK